MYQPRVAPSVLAEVTRMPVVSAPKVTVVS